MTLPGKITIGDKYGPAMEITDQAEADAYFEACVVHCLRWGDADGKPKTREEAEAIERGNLGYYAGYYGIDVQERVERLYGAIHPIFGSVQSNQQLTPEEVFQKGVEMAQRREG